MREPSPNHGGRARTGTFVPERVGIVVVALDGSEFAAGAIPVAVQLAELFGAEILLLSTVDAVDDTPRRDAELAAFSPAGAAVGRAVVVDRDPAGEIHEIVRRLDDALVCMTSHGGSAALRAPSPMRSFGAGTIRLWSSGPWWMHRDRVEAWWGASTTHRRRSPWST